MSDRKKQQCIGLFGGTFDPVHEGHLAVARLAADSLSLDRVVFIPAADPPHKNKTAAPFFHRVAMLELALTGKGDQFSISRIEAQRPAPSYTYDTLVELKRKLSGQKLFFIIGADSLLEIHLWYRYQKLFALADFIVVSRPGITQQAIFAAIDALPGGFVENKPKYHWQREDRASIYYIAQGSNDVSSSSMRLELARLVRTEAISGQVFKYIKKHHLYQSSVRDTKNKKIRDQG